MLIEKEPIHATRVRSESYKMYEVTSQRCEHVPLKMLEPSKRATKLPPLSLDSGHPFTLFFVSKANII